MQEEMRAAEVQPEYEQRRGHNLPIQLTPLIGREQELARACSFLHKPEIRLLTFTGTGGIGKTRLSLQVATEMEKDFADGVFFVNLAAVRDIELAISIIAQVLGMGSAGDQPLLERLKEFLSEKQLLLLLDNFEQLIAATALVADILVFCPSVKILVTSREALRIRGEQEFPVPPLVLPDIRSLPDLETLSHNAAVALFVQRAQAIKTTFEMNSSNAPVIAELCVRLEGLPLAIELAAAQTRLLPPRALLARLNRRLQILTGGPRDLPERQQTLRNTLKWSYELLNPDEQCLFRRLAIFVGGCTLEAAEAVCKCDSVALDIFEGASSLINKSLLQQMEQSDGEPRLVMLETIREYGQECLEANSELELLRQAHAQFALTMAEESELQVSGKQQALWLEHLERENDNLRAALLWLVETEETEMALRMASALWWFWFVRGRQSEGRNWLDRALSGSEKVTPAVRAKAFGNAGMLANSQDDRVRAKQLFTESLALYRQLGDTRNIAVTTYRLGLVAAYIHDYAEARARGEEALSLFKNLGDLSDIADSLLIISYTWLEQGDYLLARALMQEALSLFKQAGDEWGLTYTLYHLAYTVLSLKDTANAQALTEESLAHARKLGHKGAQAYALAVLGQVAFVKHEPVKVHTYAEESLAIHKETGDRYGYIEMLCFLARTEADEQEYSLAYAHYKEALEILREIDDSVLRAACLEGLAQVLIAQGRAVVAARFLGTAAAIRKGLGAPVPAIERPRNKKTLELVRSKMGQEAFSAAWSAGRAIAPTNATFILTQLTAQDDASLQQLALSAENTTASAKETRSVEATRIKGDAPQLEPISAARPGTAPEMKPQDIADDSVNELTSREIEVLRLVAMGLTNAQVANKLTISSLTVNAHLRSIYNKLSITSRSAATRYAVEHKLV